MSLSRSDSFAKLLLGSPRILCSVLSSPANSLNVNPSVCVCLFLISGSSTNTDSTIATVLSAVLVNSRSLTGVDTSFCCTFFSVNSCSARLAAYIVVCVGPRT